MVAKTSETAFKAWFRSNWEGWVEAYEPRKGGGIGIADIQVVVQRKLVPLELKVGSLENGRLHPEKVRGVQIGWHRRLNDAGVSSGFLVGCPALDRAGHDRFVAYYVDPWDIVDWRKGLEVGVYAHHIRDLNKDLPVWLDNFLLRYRSRAG